MTQSVLFYGLLCIITFVVAVIVVCPLSQRKSKVITTQRDLNIQLYKQSIATDGDDAMRLKQQLSQEEGGHTFVDVFFKPASKWSLLSVLLFIVLSAGLLYWQFGAGQQQLLYWHLQSQASAVTQELKNIHSTKQVIERLQRVVNANPGKAKGWYLLGKLYESQNQYSNAEQSFAHAVKLKSNEIHYRIAWIQASFLSHGNHLTPAQLLELESVVHAHPDQFAAANLLAVVAYKNSHYQRAINLWEGLLQQFDPSSEDAKALMAMIAGAQQRAKSDS